MYDYDSLFHSVKSRAAAFAQTHPLLVFFGTCAAVIFVVALVLDLRAGSRVEAAERRIEAEIDLRLAELNATRDRARDDAILEQYAARVVYSKDGGTPGDVADALRRGATVFVNFDSAAAGESNSLGRRCDHYSIDLDDAAAETVTCFVLRVPDVILRDGARQLSSPMVFEDHAISTSGAYLLRKYSVEGGRIDQISVTEDRREGVWSVYPR